MDLTQLIEEAQAGNARAQYDLASRYQNGEGVDLDPALAFEWFGRSAENDYVPAKTALGYYLQEGLGTVKDEKRALALFREAAAQGESLAHTYLGYSYEEGAGVEQNVEKAVSHFREAAEQGELTAQCKLGEAYLEGRGVSKDEQIAAKWIQKAASGGYVYAQRLLACLYRDGTGLEKDATTALMWFQKAASGGLMDAYLDIALYYYAEKPEGGDDLLSAYAWCKEAAAHSSEASELLVDIQSYLTEAEVLEAEAKAQRLKQSISQQGEWDAMMARTWAVMQAASTDGKHPMWDLLEQILHNQPLAPVQISVMRDILGPLAEESSLQATLEQLESQLPPMNVFKETLKDSELPGMLVGMVPMLGTLSTRVGRSDIAQLLTSYLP